MRIYLDTSALLKRVFNEAESADLKASIRHSVESGAVLASSTLSWVEVSRAAMRRFDARFDDVAEGIDEALAGVAEHEIDGEVVSLARRLQPTGLRSLGAIHVASALLLDADVLITYDDRMAAAAELNAVRCAAPGR